MKNIIGFYLINAPHSALNNAGIDEGARTENCVIIKKIRKGRESYVYVSPQSFRYWYRNTLEEKGWKMSPITREKKIAFTNANPVEYEDDDMFGYMRAQAEKDGGTVTRISPFKCSPLISVLPDRFTNDYGVMSRHEGDPVPFEYQFYSTVLKGILAIDVENVGYFIKKEKAGYKNITDKFISQYENDERLNITESGISMKKDIRIRRIKDIVEALPHISGGAKSSTHLTDVTPKFLILTAIEGGNHIFMDLADNRNGEAWVNVKLLEEVIKDYEDEILTDIYIGISEGFNDDLKKELIELSNKNISRHKIIVDSPKKAAYGFSNIISELV